MLISSHEWNLQCSWNIVSDNCCLKPQPSDRQLRRGIRKQSTWWWIARSNRLRSMRRPLPRRTGCFQTIYRNKCIWSTRGGIFCRWRSSNLPVNEKVLVLRTSGMEFVEFTFIFPLHLLHGGAKNCSKQYSQYKSPFSSTKPMSTSSRLHWGLTQRKWAGHQVFPKAVINGPLELGKRDEKYKGQHQFVLIITPMSDSYHSTASCSEPQQPC